jgi:phosphogluconate dehydratase
MGLVIGQLLRKGLLHEDVPTVAGPGLARYTQEPFLDQGRLAWRAGVLRSLDRDVVRTVDEPFSADGGLKLLRGNLGRAVIKVSAVKPQHRVVEAPARVFHEQDELLAAYDRGELARDFIAVLRFQGPQANGMPELHKLTPALAVLQDQGHKVALVTDGRMSGASGKVPAAIHVTPEALAGGPLARVRDGDMLRLDAQAGELLVLAPSDWDQRPAASADLRGHQHGCGRELFAGARALVGPAEQGASIFRDGLAA